MFIKPIDQALSGMAWLSSGFFFLLNVFYRGSLETSFPIGLPEEMGILGHGFTDFGSLWDIDETGADILDESSIRASAGLGLSWRSPFGPIRADVALPYLKEDFDEKEVFRFNFGTRF